MINTTCRVVIDASKGFVVPRLVLDSLDTHADTNTSTATSTSCGVRSSGPRIWTSPPCWSSATLHCLITCGRIASLLTCVGLLLLLGCCVLCYVLCLLLFALCCSSLQFNVLPMFVFLQAIVSSFEACIYSAHEHIPIHERMIIIQVRQCERYVEPSQNACTSVLRINDGCRAFSLRIM